MKKTIFVVDDNDTNLTMAKNVLKEHYKVLTLPSGAKMFALLEKITPDLILLDIKMPEMDGFEALRRLKGNAAMAEIPVIFVTGITDVDIEVMGFQMGAVDFIAKPFSPPVLLNRIKTHLNIDDIIRERTSLLQKKTIQLQRLQHGIVHVVADMVENRDRGTGGHIERTSIYIKILVDTMIERGIYAEELKEMDLYSFVSSARLHDVGKIAISDAILNKPGQLTDDEYEIMKTHAAVGERIIDQIVTRTDNVEFLRNAKLFAGYHHEYWDGSGYPYGLKGTEIPLQGRIMAIVDVFDALISKRPYKEEYQLDEAVEIIMNAAGTQFDPIIAEAFFAARELLVAVANGYT